MNKRSIIHSVAACALLTTAACAQNLPAPAGPASAPPRAAAAPYTGPALNESGSVRYIVYGPQGEVQTVILHNDKVVMLPPDLGVQLGTSLKPGTSVAVTGFQRAFGGQQQLTVQSIRVNGQTFNAAAAPAPPPPPAAPAPPAAQPAAPPAQPAPPAAPPTR